MTLLDNTPRSELLELLRMVKRSRKAVWIFVMVHLLAAPSTMEQTLAESLVPLVLPEGIVRSPGSPEPLGEEHHLDRMSGMENLMGLNR